ncbi:MAG: type II toxin-antitoxin system VapC family toxin [Gemmatimonadetes bacterium]|nr:type II toxin-antitoxin system VapC family toxin [Gemmatimonadota bacterium]
MIVADTNLITYLLLAGERTEEAERVFEADSGWAAPLLWRSEFRNVLTFYVRRGLLSLEGALEAMDKAELLLSGREYLLESPRVMELAVLSGCSAYDCEFVALAEELDVPLVTSDATVLAAFPKVAVEPATFTKTGRA